MNFATRVSCGLLLLSLAMAMARQDSLVQMPVATIGSVVWYGFFAALLSGAIFLTRTIATMAITAMTRMDLSGGIIRRGS